MTEVVMQERFVKNDRQLEALFTDISERLLLLANSHPA